MISINIPILHKLYDQTGEQYQYRLLPLPRHAKKHQLKGKK